eukprot:GHVS01073010.1.p2 GENE.GHVS01073010.1~~GHVS01073010.1.p2  ORF type:complete len:180 (+),score=35.90 GHVS01073010.1:135-674(+)
MYCYTQTVAIMADDDQKVKRQDAAVASSSLLSTSSARMYGKYSLKVFWAIGLFFLLSSMETTPAEAVGYPEEMKREIDERRKANNFTNLKNIEIYGNATDETVPVLWYLDELETVVKNILAGNVLVYDIKMKLLCCELLLLFSLLLVCCLFVVCCLLLCVCDVCCAYMLCVCMSSCCCL